MATTSLDSGDELQLIDFETPLPVKIAQETSVAIEVARVAPPSPYYLRQDARIMRCLRDLLSTVSTARRPQACLAIDELMAAQMDAHRNAVQHFWTTKPANAPDISMVIPAYNEEGRILPTLLSIVEYFSHCRRCYEVIVVDDGSWDRTTQLVQELARRFPSIKLIRLPRKMGKGAAVRTGIRNAIGRFIMYNDADGATPIAEIERLFAAIEHGADLAIGSRALHSPGTHVERRWGRAVVGRLFALIVNIWVVPNIADTQCGFKMFRRDIAQQIFEIQRLNGFAFDVEVLRIASVMGYRIAEVPINWTHVHGSKVNMLRDALCMLRDICLVRYLVPRWLAVSIQAPSDSYPEKISADTSGSVT
jgi:dolichyl-phosphate beta-glucosyltransferase